MKKLTVLSVAHFCVDMACAALFFGWLGKGSNWWLCMILYNACAFALQLPLGLLADKADRNMPFAAAGCVLVAVSFLLTGSPLPAAVVCGLGNGMFHVGGGLEVLNGSHRAAPLGVFVSPGALGLYLGTAGAAAFVRSAWALPLLMILTGAGILLTAKADRSFLSRNAPLSIRLPKGDVLPLLCLFLVVVLRSLLGSGAFSTGDAHIPGFVPVLCLALGKAAGGFLGDGLGLRKAAILSLGLTAALLLFPRGYVTLVALFLFNMIMPLTLYEAAWLLPGAKGGAFGLLTCALFVGMLPRFLGATQDLPGLFWAGLAVLSLGLLMVGLRKEAAHG